MFGHFCFGKYYLFNKYQNLVNVFVWFFNQFFNLFLFFIVHSYFLFMCLILYVWGFCLSICVCAFLLLTESEAMDHLELEVQCECWKLKQGSQKEQKDPLNTKLVYIPKFSLLYNKMSSQLNLFLVICVIATRLWFTRKSSLCLSGNKT